MHPEYGFRIGPNWPDIGKVTMMSQFIEMTSSSKFFDIVVLLVLKQIHIFFSSTFEAAFFTVKNYQQE